MTSPSQPLQATLWQLLPEGICLDEQRQQAFGRLVITGLALDSRRVLPGNLFIAVAGSQQDGRAFIGEAVKRGCAAVIADASGLADVCPAQSLVGKLLEKNSIPLIACENLLEKVSAIAARFYGEPGAAMTVFGVTGTNGKTTVASLLSQLNSLLNGVSGLVGTLGYGTVIQGVTELAETGMTTPDAISLQGILDELRAAGATTVAMEVSSHSLDQHRVDAAGIDHGIFTNLSRDHLDYHGDEASYGAAKEALFSLPGLRTAIVNGDDSFGRALLQRLPAGLVAYSYGLGEHNQVRASSLRLSTAGIRAHIHSPWGEGVVHSSLLGEFNLCNLLAVIAAACAAGADFAEVLATVPKLHPVSGRMEVVTGGNGPTVVVDYAHTPDALEKALLALKALSGGRLWCVFGCGGDRDSGKRPTMGAVAERLADCLLVTSDNPRSEAPESIIAAILAGMEQPENAQAVADRQAAIENAIAMAAVGDTVLIAGKGHENYQQLGSEKRPFSDVLVARAALIKRAGGEL